MWNKDIIIVKEGQFITGRKQLNEITGIPESTIEDILAFLESQGQIQQQKTTKFRLITIINWKEYQNSDNKATTKQQQADTNKNDKNDKNEKKEDSSASKKKGKPHFRGLEMRWFRGRYWVVPNDGGSWLEFAGKESEIEWK